MCGDVNFKSFCSRVQGENATRESKPVKRRRALGGGICLRQCSKVNFCLADSFSLRQALHNVIEIVFQILAAGYCSEILGLELLVLLLLFIFCLQFMLIK